ncbi:MAG: glycosyltransferase family 4 protein [Pseudomonadota bacterium]
MKVLLLTNMPSGHQMQFAQAMARELGVDNFRIVFHQDTSDSRTEMGWEDNFAEPFVIRYWLSEQTRQETSDWIDSADVVIQGRFPIKLVRQRIKSGKLTFAYQERYWKRRFSYGKLLFRLPRIIRNFWSVDRANYHLLAAGAYTTHDLNRIGVFRHRSWKFGYFLEPEPELQERLSSNGLTIVWCARICAVKQPEQAIEIATRLRDRGVKFKLKMIGDGELRSSTEESVQQHGLQEQFQIMGWQPSEVVAREMRQADFFLMTSHGGEGWGMVVNEAMAQGCATVVNRCVGSAPWLVQHSKTGLLYTDQQLDQLTEEITARDSGDWEQMGEAARAYLMSTWSCSVAAQRLIQLSQTLLTEDQQTARELYSDGPCSPAV